MEENPKLQDQKLLAEIKLLESQLEERNSRDKIESSVKKWTGVVLAIVSVLSAVIGVIIPLSNYIHEKKNELNYKLNDQMIELVDQLSNPDPVKSENAAILLGYYERNAVPVLLYKLERIPKDTLPDLKILINSVISGIYDRNRSETLALIEETLSKNINILVVTKNPENQTDYAVTNLLELITSIHLTKRDSHKVAVYLSELRDKLEQSPYKSGSLKTIGDLDKMINIYDH